MKKTGNIDKILIFESGDMIQIEGFPDLIEFTGVGTATLDNDRVLSDASFYITVNGERSGVTIENLDGRSSPAKLGDFKFTLDFADGYSKTCGLIVSKAE